MWAWLAGEALNELLCYRKETVLQRQVARGQCSRLYQDCITVSHRQACPREELGY